MYLHSIHLIWVTNSFSVLLQLDAEAVLQHHMHSSGKFAGIISAIPEIIKYGRHKSVMFHTWYTQYISETDSTLDVKQKDGEPLFSLGSLPQQLHSIGQKESLVKT